MTQIRTITAFPSFCLLYNLYIPTGDVQKLIQLASLKDPNFEKLKEVCWTLITFFNLASLDESVIGLVIVVINYKNESQLSWRDEG